MNEMRRFSAAMVFAAELHAEQFRKGTDIPYISHLIAVASLVLEHGGSLTEATAALLHDSVEDQAEHYPGGAAALRAAIQERFGLAVLEIVNGCTDADTYPKPPWRERKQRYIAHLSDTSPSVRLVSCADKLHNARSILTDLRTVGEEVFERFNAGRDGTLWYYNELASVPEARADAFGCGAERDGSADRGADGRVRFAGRLDGMPLQASTTMTSSHLLILILLVALALGGPLIAGFIVVWRRRERRSRRRSPLTADLLRPPGHSVRARVDELRDNVDEVLIVLVALPLLIYAIHVTQSYIFAAPESIFRIGLSVLVGIVTIAWGALRLTRLSRQLDLMRIGTDAEMAVGQELDQLMRGGAVVFHDVPAEKFNVDHLVIAPSGVFAVETKGRSKPIRGQGSEDASVLFDGHALHFPGWTETAPLAQAQRQAKWVADWLTSAVGSPVDAKPVLAIPGWWIDRKGPSPVLIFNGKKPQFLLGMRVQALSAEMIQRISYQVEQRCRTVKPAYARE